MIDNYYKDNLGIIHQREHKPFIKNYASEYDELGEKSHYLSHLRLGFINGAIPDIKHCNSILDVGFGNGDFLRVCKKQFETCAGYDLFYDHLPVHCVKEKSLFDNYYDIFTFFDSLEHFDNIFFLDRLKCKYVVISVPNCYMSDDRLFTDWKHRKPDEHLHHFNEQSLTAFLQYSKYKVIKVSFFEDVIRKNPGVDNILTVVGEKL